MSRLFVDLTENYAYDVVGALASRSPPGQRAHTAAIKGDGHL